METKKERFTDAWKTVFEVEEVRDDDNFFEIGGDSMKGVQLLGALAERGLKLDMLKLYTQPTVEELVEAAEEMEPVAIPADVMSGNLSGEELEKYLADPTIQKAMDEFGIRPEDIMEKMGTKEKKSEAEAPKAAGGEGAGAVPPFMGAQPGAVPPFVGMQPGELPPFMSAQPGTGPLQPGYLIPVPVMYYFVPVSDLKGLPAQPQGVPPFPGFAPIPGVTPIQGATPIPVMAYPVYLSRPNGMGEKPEETDPDKKES